MGWWRWFVNQERPEARERLTAPFFRFVKQEPFEALVLGRVKPGSGLLLSGDRLVVEIWADRRREKADSEE